MKAARFHIRRAGDVRKSVLYALRRSKQRKAKAAMRWVLVAEEGLAYVARQLAKAEAALRKGGAR